MRLILLSLPFLLLSGCSTSPSEAPNTQEAIWRLGWRMAESTMNKNLQLADLQFDSLLQITEDVDQYFLRVGLETKSALNKDEQVVDILSQQNEDILRRLCQKDLLASYSPCEHIPMEQVQDTALQMELIKMYVDDQAARGNIMEDIIAKYSVPKETITNRSGVFVDKANRDRLKEIFSEFGFPTKKLVGREAMYGIFLMIQHADGDKEWQKAQLPNIEKAVKNGDLDGQSYAYLYDRIMVNSGQKQRYGTQFANVDLSKGIAELAETEDIAHLDDRRRELGLMPISMYKRFMFR